MTEGRKRVRPFPVPAAIAALIAGLVLGASSLHAADIPPQAPSPSAPAAAVGRRPPIVIVPVPGTELLDRATGGRVWPSAGLMARRDGNELLALPDDPSGSSHRPRRVAAQGVVAG